ncbi:DUF1616 domain-containing protein [Haloarcula nitratireducens]|uniref:DUF1616 domain-containing protein n=1 Tax=Haloarcula nitratireducens TaxID=2487749 RepID=A0AAW4PDP4_9EURY|nr:DUF1616 domain-containing protein [Halomicroarcula nitratireducens]MBX0295765.1 DUF1616 domain-containing protein [Halomicroarcula nitratireducens]
MNERLGAVVDLLAVLLLLGAATAVVVVEPPGGALLRVPLLLPAILFLPGYALVSFLYPDAPGNQAARNDDGWSLTPLERAGFAIAASVAIVPIIALVFNFTPYGVRGPPVLGGTIAVTAVLTLAAFVRRARLPAERRFRVSVGFAGGLRKYFTTDRRGARQHSPFEVKSDRHRVLNLVLVAAIFLLLSSVAYAAVGPTLPSQDQDSTEFYLLDENGEYLLGVEEPLDGGSVPANIVIANHEKEDVQYTVVVKRQQVSVGDNRTQVQQERVTDRFQTSVAAGETERIERTFEGGGENVRVQVLLFRGGAPENPTAADAYREARFWPAGNPTESGGN